MHHTDEITQDLTIKKTLLKPYGSILILVVPQSSAGIEDVLILVTTQVFLSTIMKEDRDE